MREEYSVYILTINYKPVYIGCTKQIKIRINKHKNSDKAFNGYVIVDTFGTKKEALAAERTLIKYYSMFSSDVIYNASYKKYEIEKNAFEISKVIPSFVKRIK